jgi:hypothetical protein
MTWSSQQCQKDSAKIYSHFICSNSYLIIIFKHPHFNALQIPRFYAPEMSLLFKEYMKASTRYGVHTGLVLSGGLQSANHISNGHIFDQVQTFTLMCFLGVISTWLK